MLERLDRRGRVAAFPCQNTRVVESLRLTRRQCEEAAWAVTPEGRQYRGAAALRLTLACALELPVLFRVLDVPGLRQLQSAAYELVARNRRRLPGGKPYCERRPNECR